MRLLDESGLVYLWSKFKLLLSKKADTTHTHSTATSSDAGFMSASDKSKLDGIATGATKTIVDSELSSTSTNPVQNKAVHTALNGKAATGHIHDAASTSTDGFMSAADKTKLDGIATGATKITVDSSLSSSSTNPVQNKVINSALSGKADSSHGHDNASTSAAGFMSADDKTKLNGIDTGANKYTHPTYTAKSSGLYKMTVDETGHISAATAATKSDITALGIPASDTTYSDATTSKAGLMSATDKAKLDGITSGANNVTVDSALSSTSTNPVQNKVINSALEGKAPTDHTHALETLLPTGGTAGQLLTLGNDGKAAWGDKDVLVVTVDETTGKASHTSTEIFAAIAAGKFAYLPIGNGYMTVSSPVTTNKDKCYFECRTSHYSEDAYLITDVYAVYSIDSNGLIESEYYGLNPMLSNLVPNRGGSQAGEFLAVTASGGTEWRNLPTTPVTASGDGATYTATVDGVTSLTVGLQITIIPNTTSTTTLPKLNLNSLGAKNIKQGLSVNTSLTVQAKNEDWLVANKPVTLIYDGTQWKTTVARSSGDDMYGTVPVENGGTGASTLADAQTALGITALSTRVSTIEAAMVTVHSGSAAPASTLGEDGDIYLVTE